MAGFVQVAVTADFAKAKGQLEHLDRALSDLTGLNEEIGAYLVSSTRNRIYSTKKAPDGTPWAKNTELTQALKGSGSVLYHTGELASSIRVSDADRAGVTVVAEAPYAGYVQEGAKRLRGRYKSKDKSIPARPFMGISDENKRRIRKMIKDHIADSLSHGSGDSLYDMGFGG